MKEEIYLSDLLWELVGILTPDFSFWEWLSLGVFVLVFASLMINSICWWYQKLK